MYMLLLLLLLVLLLLLLMLLILYHDLPLALYNGVKYLEMNYSKHKAT